MPMQKKYMLKKNKEFRYVHSKGSSCADTFLVLISVKNKAGMRVGFSVSKKLGNAVKRNHIKRLLRECATRLMPLLGQRSYLFVARTAAAEADYHTLLASMEKLLLRSGAGK